MIHFIDILINWCLVFVVSFNLINLFVGKLIPIPDLMERVITAGACYILIHALHVLIAITFVPHIRYVNWAAPYGLGYGPLLFFAVRATRAQTFKWTAIVLHMSPLLLFFVMYVLGLSEQGEEGSIHHFLRFSLYPLILLSFMAYGLYAIAQSRRPIISAVNVKLISKASSLALLTGFLFIAIILNNNSAATSYLIPRLFLYILLLTISSILLHHKIMRLRQPLLSTPAAGKQIQIAPQKSHYRKSMLSKAALLAYQERLETVIEAEKIFLDATLSIDKLSHQLDIPKHHLSQVFNIQIGKNFSVYINEARIRYACNLLSTQPTIAMEQLAYQSGFNSKVSFYRHFKQQIGCTPTTYLKRITRI